MDKMRIEKQQKLLSSRLKELLKNHNMTQTEAARKLGVSPQTFNTWTQEKAMPRMDKLQKLAEMFGVTTAYFVDEQIVQQVDFLAAELSVIEAMQMALSKDIYIKDYKYTDDELIQILNYARFIKEHKNGRI